MQNLKYYFLVLAFALCALHFTLCNAAQVAKEGPIIVNGDTVEYSADNKKITATGNVEIVYKGSRLTCQRLSVDTQGKVGVAEGDVRLDDQKGIIEGSKIIYNFQNKTGIVFDSGFRANPYFGKAEKIEKISDNEFIAFKGYATTCAFNNPHYRIKSKQMNIFPQDKIQTRQDAFCVGNTPILYLPKFNHSLKDPMMHVRFMPGTGKDWGAYMLSAWRYNLTDNVDGRIYLDYRNKLGIAEGLGLNYKTADFGKGDYKLYYTKEKPQDLEKNVPKEYVRHFMRWRHKWDIDRQTNFTSEFYKITDERRKILDSGRNFLKDYFYREYEKDSQPLSYGLFHHSFRYSSMDLLMQKRTNHWYDQLDKLPEAKYTLPSLQIDDSPFYFESNVSITNFNKKAVTSPATTDEESVARLDATNKFSLPMKVAFFRFSPFVSDRKTIYDKGSDGKDMPLRTTFYSGADISTKFYRIFNAKSDLLGMNISGLRHIITPTIGYVYNHEPTIQSSKLKQIDSIDSLSRSNAATLELSNKLQTKRKGENVDLADVRVSSSYIFKPKTGEKLGSNLSDIVFDIKLLPYSWLRLDADATYKHSGTRSDANYKHFSNANYDINFDLGKGCSFGLGERYQRKGGNAVTSSFNWRLNPKWKFLVYERFERGHDPTLKRGLREQEYSISRDLHCWNVDLTYNVKRGEGETIWLIFRIKAFPETEFGFDQSYHQPKAGSQTAP